MHVNGQTTVWGTPIGVNRARDTKRWYQQLKAWWAEHRAARRAARLAALRAGWDARREAVRPFHAEAAINLVAFTHACSTTAALCDLSIAAQADLVHASSIRPRTLRADAGLLTPPRHAR